ncbi:predicted protein [Naegleria gruberi]|uniref:Predicted protein n=1 Tax=Naegleria gruberi TaxID=5762 RepID=D2W5X5_NAEGR|nr:uncharacterized protein NAEGRDRAFT_76819 [Naegleria gruberi]EFC35528.1 predicted protein [Naegleria gruberi]|eukprot:XP_002668272.1 predicted protein [Naegleria gruberi strain NEG-M]
MSSQQQQVSNTNNNNNNNIITEPEDTNEYKFKHYWDSRFEKEEQYDWLGTYSQWKQYLTPILLSTNTTTTTIINNNTINNNTTDDNNNTINEKKKELKILIIGCGNSTLGQDMYMDGYTNIINMDYSSKVIEKMKLKYPNMEWIEMDMLDMKGFENETFDIVLDKGTMDALVVDAGDPWDPEQHVRYETLKMCKEIYRILKPSGRFLQITFSQPHFRKIFLNPQTEDNQNVLDWSIKHVYVEEIGFGYPLFNIQKPPFN